MIKKEVKLNNGVSIPTIGLGTWLSAPGEVKNIVIKAIEIGYRHIDCAACYGNEEEVGDALQEIFSKGTVKREDLFITSKLWNNSHARNDIAPALEKTLKDLKLDYLDLYLIHWPMVFKKEVGFPKDASDYLSLDEVPIKETWQGMEDLYEKGLVRAIGVSNFSIKKLQDILSYANIIPAVNQVERHPYFQQRDLLSFCKSNGITLTGYCPLGSSGRPDMMKASDEPHLLNDPLISDIAHRNKVSNAQVILNWAMERNGVVIPKTVTPQRAQENLESANLEISKEDLLLIDKIDKNYRYVKGDFFAPEGGPYTLQNIWDEE